MLASCESPGHPREACRAAHLSVLPDPEACPALRLQKGPYHFLMSLVPAVRRPRESLGSFRANLELLVLASASWRQAAFNPELVPLHSKPRLGPLGVEGSKCSPQALVKAHRRSKGAAAGAASAANLRLICDLQGFESTLPNRVVP